jgi:hypothetical protein
LVESGYCTEVLFAGHDEVLPETLNLPSKLNWHLDPMLSIAAHNSSVR